MCKSLYLYLLNLLRWSFFIDIKQPEKNGVEGWQGSGGGLKLTFQQKFIELKIDKFISEILKSFLHLFHKLVKAKSVI